MQEIEAYRCDKLPEVKKIIEGLDNLVFGGCGGDIKELLKVYVGLHN